MDYIITNSQYNLLSENVKTYNFNKKNLTDDFKLFAKVLNTTNKRTGKPYYDFSDIYPGLKIMFIEPMTSIMTENGAEITINVEDALPREIRQKWWNGFGSGKNDKSYKEQVMSRLYELKTLMGFGYDFGMKVYP